jgi:hypothetical protein
LSEPFTVIALLAAFNEEDIVGQVVENLIREGIQVYFIDNGSSDATVAAVEPFLGRGLIRIETLTSGENCEPGDGRHPWRAILQRKEALARELEADWFIHHDADEFRESPWPGLNLRDAIQKVDRFGYNAIDFEVLNFWPTHDIYRRGDDVRESFRFYAPGEHFNRTQVKCWKNLGVAVDLATVGGHDVNFPDRKVFPLRFLLRHYPIRGQAHGERKVHAERLGRFPESEKSAGWHVQYDDLVSQPTFIRDPGTLVAYDPEAARLQLILRHRTVDALERQLTDETLRWHQERAELEERRRALASTAAQYRRDLEEIRSSTIWRWTAPLRDLITWIRLKWHGPKERWES